MLRFLFLTLVLLVPLSLFAGDNEETQKKIDDLKTRIEEYSNLSDYQSVVEKTRDGIETDLSNLREKIVEEVKSGKLNSGLIDGFNGLVIFGINKEATVNGGSFLVENYQIQLYDNRSGEIIKKYLECSDVAYRYRYKEGCVPKPSIWDTSILRQRVSSLLIKSPDWNIFKAVEILTPLFGIDTANESATFGIDTANDTATLLKGFENDFQSYAFVLIVIRTMKIWDPGCLGCGWRYVIPAKDERWQFSKIINTDEDLERLKFLLVNFTESHDDIPFDIKFNEPMMNIFKECSANKLADELFRFYVLNNIWEKNFINFLFRVKNQYQIQTVKKVFKSEYFGSCLTYIRPTFIEPAIEKITNVNQSDVFVTLFNHKIKNITVFDYALQVVNSYQSNCMRALIDNNYNDDVYLEAALKVDSQSMQDGFINLINTKNLSISEIDKLVAQNGK